MRVSIVLAICFLGVASASTLTKRSFLDDFQNKSQNAFHDLEHFGQDFQQKLQDALKNLFGNKNETEKTLAKRDLMDYSAQLMEHANDPIAFTQDLVKVLGQMAQGPEAAALKATAQEYFNKIFGQQKQKRDVAEDIQKFQEKTQQAFNNLGLFGQDFQQKLQDALKNLFGNKNETENVIVKRATNPLALINDLKDLDTNPGKFVQDLLKVLADMALQGRRKRDLAEDLKKFADAGKQKVKDALKKMMDLFNSFQNGGASDETSTEKTVSKRDVSEDLQKIAAAGKEKVEAAIKQLQALFEQVKGGFNHDESSATVTKRDITESLKQFGQAAQEKTQAAFKHLKEAFASLFNGLNKPIEEVEEEVSTEVSVAKRSLTDFYRIQDFQQKAQESLSGFRDAISNFFNQFRKPAPQVDEDTTESS